jgi:hypothetical protein
MISFQFLVNFGRRHDFFLFLYFSLYHTMGITLKVLSFFVVLFSLSSASRLLYVEKPVGVVISAFVLQLAQKYAVPSFLSVFLSLVIKHHPLLCFLLSSFFHLEHNSLFYQHALSFFGSISSPLIYPLLLLFFTIFALSSTFLL